MKGDEGSRGNDTVLRDLFYPQRERLNEDERGEEHNKRTPRRKSAEEEKKSKR